MAQPAPVVVVGAGPVGLVAALHARRLGRDVDLLTVRLPAERRHVECVPAQTIALLLEYGIAPASLGVGRLYEARHLQWSHSQPISSRSAASAHVSRPELELALLAQAERCGVRIAPVAAVEEVSDQVDPHCLVLDATGRASVTAERRWRPDSPIVCRTFHFAAPPSPDQGALALAAGPDGYVYRLGNRNGICLGVVGPGELIKGHWPAIRERIVRFAPWVVADLDGNDVQAGGAGACSLQWADMGPRATPIGDAAIARDALSSQGLALGIGGALHAVSTALTGRSPGPARNGPEALYTHAGRVLGMIRSSPFRHHPAWRAYGAFLETHGPGTIDSG